MSVRPSAAGLGICYYVGQMVQLNVLQRRWPLPVSPEAGEQACVGDVVGRAWLQCIFRTG